jgi:hypothetical protein
VFQTKKTQPPPETVEEVEENERYIREELPATQVDIDPSDYRSLTQRALF